VTDHNTGLSSKEALLRQRRGLANRERKIKSNSYLSIIRRNVFTFFNLINIILAALILMNGVDFKSLRNVLFLGVAICNSLIGIVQEFRAKHATDRLKVIVEKQVAVIRDSAEVIIPLHKIVLGDIIVLTAGNQVPADCRVEWGSCVADESVLTGEPDGVIKKPGDTLLSGSFIISGTCRACAVAVGENSYGNRLARQAKHMRRQKSDIVRTINVILAVMSVAILPVGTSLFIAQFEGDNLAQAVFSTSAAVIGMLPEGMVLLASTVFAVTAIMLARFHVLSQDLYSAEALARTDVICLDKTGTLTEGVLEIDKIIPLSDNYTPALLADFIRFSTDRNPTALAIKSYCNGITAQGGNLREFVPFDSYQKYSAAHFDDGSVLIVGAADFFANDIGKELFDEANRLSSTNRMVLFAKKSAQHQKAEPLAFILLRDKLRPTASDTLKHFASQGVSVIIISGDHPATAGDVARRAGIEGWDRQVDMTHVKESEIDSAVAGNVIFGRVSPEQKRNIIQALRRAGHTVTMMGDGVNDVLALKEADCSVAPAAATDIARDASKLILLKNDFDALPEVLRQGRRSINNLKRSISLFLIKIIYSLVLSLAFVFINESYPFEPIHLTLITFVGVAVPGLFLSFEPNYNRVEGKFINDIFTRSLPGGIAIATGVIVTALLSPLLNITHSQYVTVCVVASGIAMLMNLAKMCMPFNLYRGVLWCAMCLVFVMGVFLFGWVFSLTALTAQGFIALGICVLCDIIVYLLVLLITTAIVKRRSAI